MSTLGEIIDKLRKLKEDIKEVSSDATSCDGSYIEELADEGAKSIPRWARKIMEENKEICWNLERSLESIDEAVDYLCVAKSHIENRDGD